MTVCRPGATLAAAGVPLAGACGNVVTVTDAGQTGITVDGAGAPVVVVTTCDSTTPIVGMYEGRSPDDREDEPNTERGAWTARRPVEGSVVSEAKFAAYECG